MTWEQRERLEQEMVARPVRSLQYMLRRLSTRYEELPELQPDGRFGERTLESVMRYQKRKGLPITGVVDQATWTAVRDEWMEVERDLAHPRQLRGFPVGEVVTPGESRDFLYVTQAMFQALGHSLEDLEEEHIDGIHNGTSVENAMWLQEKAGLERTGNMDRDTWDALSALYELFVVRQADRFGPGRG